MSKKLLIITTNYSGNSCSSDIDCIRNTGVFLEEFAVPYLIFEKSNINLTVASIKGGNSPVDESSMSCSNPMEWDKCIKILRNTKKIYDIDYKSFDGVYFPGGHGPLFDISSNAEIAEIAGYFFGEGKLVSAICHGVAALVGAKFNGKPIVENQKVTSFTNEEEKIGKLANLVPFSVEDELKKLGANFVSYKSWAEHVEVSNNIITGQNQNSSTLIAEKILEFLNK